VSGAEVAEVGLRDAGLRLLARFADRRQQNADEQGNDGNDYQQFDDRERSRISRLSFHFVRSHTEDLFWSAAALATEFDHA